MNPSTAISLVSPLLNRSRPHTLIRGAIFGTPALEYRYDDTNKMTTVLNVWENQTLEMQLAGLRHTAAVLDDTAKSLERCPMLHSPAEVNACRIADHRRRASLYRLMAERLQLLETQGLAETFRELAASIEAA